MKLLYSRLMLGASSSYLALPAMMIALNPVKTILSTCISIWLCVTMVASYLNWYHPVDSKYRYYDIRCVQVALFLLLLHCCQQSKPWSIYIWLFLQCAFYRLSQRDGGVFVETLFHALFRYFGFLFCTFGTQPNPDYIISISATYFASLLALSPLHRRIDSENFRRLYFLGVCYFYMVIATYIITTNLLDASTPTIQ